MVIYPAIDIRGGKCVRLKRGDFDCETIYGDPLEMAKGFMSAGAKWIHMVDLDGARTGKSKNIHIIETVAAMGIKIQLGGGIRSLDDVRARIEMGVSRCVIGSAAVEQPDMVASAAAQFPGRIAVGIDARDGLVAVHGWEDKTEAKPTDLALEMKEAGVSTIIYTDIARDGMKTGPNIEASARLAERTGMDIIVSGGVSGLEDLIEARRAGMPGIIIGKALYDGNIDIKQALKLQEEKQAWSK